MALTVESLKDEQIDKVAGVARTKMPRGKAEIAEFFIREFYRNVPPDDMLQESPEALYGAALSLMRFGETRRPGEAKVRVFNPRADQHGWHSGHTIIELVNDDMPFLVDSVTAELNRRSLTVHLVIHPILGVERDAAGRVTALHGGIGHPPAASRESYMHVEIDEQTSPAALKALETGLLDILGDVRAAVEDWPKMLREIEAVLKGLQAKPPKLPRAEIEEAIAFLQWIHDDHFTFLGYRELRLIGAGRQVHFDIVADSGLGILRDPQTEVFEGLRRMAALPPEVLDFLQQPNLLVVTKANRRSTVHRPVHLDAIGIKIFDAEGVVAGERLFVGLFTSVAYNVTPRHIPFLRRKVQAVMDRSGFDPKSHIGKALMHVLETYPRDELFQIEPENLYDIARGIANLQERQRIALFLRRDPFERFVSALVYVPRERYTVVLRQAMEDILAAAFNGSISAYYTQFGDEPLGRLHFIVKTQPGAIPAYDPKEIEARLREAGRTWSDRLLEALIDDHGEERGNALHRRYAEAFPTAYREEFSVPTAVADIDRIEETLRTGELGMNLYRPLEAEANRLRFKLYQAGAPVPLSDALPVLENMGLRAVSEIPYEVHFKDDGRDQADAGRTVYIHDFDLATRDGETIDIGAMRDPFHEAFARVWRREVEDDGFNRLVLGAGLQWREVVVLRAFSKYLRQVGILFSQAYMEDVLAQNAALAGRIVKLFILRFDPDFQGERQAEESALAESIGRLLADVSNLDDDRILRRFLNLVQAALRTNYFQRTAEGGPKPYISFKFDSRRLDDLPLPKPLYEIWIYGPHFEAVHLRFGLVARGGMRWSDRREDFRTEILGLVKAQQVKNGVIVPVGAKGGFVLKRAPAPSDREAFLAEGVACYKDFVRAMLDITDNLVGEAVVPPERVVRKDGDDPYLVVAADKGTASFSDYANGIAAEYGFWLGDAFASGGSAGYDHKAMGITARGGWESVKRHFRERGRDIQNHDFTVVGIGDMSGDVFGNGMLQSRHIRLLGAFNHLHIFVDPDPDAEASFAERQRLFDLPRSSWTDYDAKLISKGGGVFDRKAKSIALSPEIKRAFDIAADEVTPAELIRHMLRAPVDLLWFGGIGTYVKSSDESHAEVGDRANDALRVDGEALRCKVVGEGANLGVTQRGRIEYARRGAGGTGGRINTDFIDNSAGVDCSDHEVNIKIALGEVVQRGDMTLKQRDRLLEKMTEEVARLVLRDNYQQTQAISVAEAQAVSLLDQQQRFIRTLERAGQLNRSIEYLPDDEEIAERQALKIGMTRPEIAVLLAYAKIATYQELLPTDLPDDPLLGLELLRYFPKPLQEQHSEAIARHKLRREIISTVVVNSMVNRVGPSFVNEMKEATGQPASEIARAYIIARDVLDLRSLWAAIEALDNKVDAAIQIEMFIALNRLVAHAVLWFLRSSDGRPMNIAEQVETYRPRIAELSGAFDRLLGAEDQAKLQVRVAHFAGRGVPDDLAQRMARLDVLASATDIVRIAVSVELPAIDVAAVYFGLGARFGLDWLRGTAQAMAPNSPWQKRALAAIVDDLYTHQCVLTMRVLDRVAGKDGTIAPERLIESWTSARERPVARAEALIDELRTAKTVDLAMLAVANRELRSLVGD